MRTIVSCMVCAAFMALESNGAAHIEAGTTVQDEAIAVALDAGLSQDSYLAMSYGIAAEQMLNDAFEARAKYFADTATVIKHLSNGDIRNVPCMEPIPNMPKESYLRFSRRMKLSMYVPNEPIPTYGKMYGETNAFLHLLADMERKVGRPLVMNGDHASIYKDQFDPQLVSYSAWPLGIAIHSSGSYAEEVSHFFNSMHPRMISRVYKGNWSTPDNARVTIWNEYISALRGVKVYAFAHGVNLNESHITYTSVIGQDGSSTSVENVGTPKFDVFWNLVKDEVDVWTTNGRWPIATNSYILLLAYKEAISHEGKDTDNAAYRRFREMCRDFNIARMVL